MSAEVTTTCDGCGATTTTASGKWADWWPADNEDSRDYCLVCAARIEAAISNLDLTAVPGPPAAPPPPAGQKVA